MKTLFSHLKSWGLCVLLLAVGLVSCKEDDPSLYLALDRPSLYIETYGTTAEMGYTVRAASSVKVYAVPEGWSAELDQDRRVIVVTSPAEESETNALSGVITISAYTSEGSSTTEYLYVSMIAPIDLSDQRANSYIITRADRAYIIPVDRQGERGGTLSPASVTLVWQSPGSLIDGLEYAGGKLQFQVKSNEGELIPGNALVAARNAAGEILWTWHLWVTDSEPQTRGRYMDRNLGAAYADPTSDRVEILRSYGTYYQWGRMTPFVGPYAYNCAASMDAYMYTEGNGKMLYLTYAETSGSKGTVDYAIAHPLVFLLGSEKSDYDWNYNHNGSLWSTTEKSVYDPCPKGWRVADSFEGLTIADSGSADLATLEAQFGWPMEVGDGVTSFFLGAGRRSWLEGLITNVNTLETPKPWIGYYWTSHSDTNNESEAMYFTLDTEDPARSELNTALRSPRANGMQVRCIKE